MPPKKDPPRKKFSAPAALGVGKKTKEEKDEKDKKKNIIQEGFEFIVSNTQLAYYYYRDRRQDVVQEMEGK